MRLPDFLIIGAQKAGTTALYHALRQHPALFLPDLKEPHFFSYDGVYERGAGPGAPSSVVRDVEAYSRLFTPARLDQLTGEASPSYLYVERAAGRIHARIPDAKMIAILRQPVERAYSNYLHTLRSGRETSGSFLEALAAEDERVEAGWGPQWHYRRKGLYAPQIERFLRLFPVDHLRVVLYDDLRTDMQRVLRDLWAFLDVDDRVEVDTRTRHNVSLLPANRLGKALVTAYVRIPARHRDRLVPPRFRHLLRDRLLKRPDRLDADLKADLTECHFRGDIEQLQALLGRDLSHWLGGRPAS